MSEVRDLWVAMLAQIGLVLVKAINADREYRVRAFIMSTKMPFTYRGDRGDEHKRSGMGWNDDVTNHQPHQSWLLMPDSRKSSPNYKEMIRYRSWFSLDKWLISHAEERNRSTPLVTLTRYHCSSGLDAYADPKDLQFLERTLWMQWKITGLGRERGNSSRDYHIYICSRRGQYSSQSIRMLTKRQHWWYHRVWKNPPWGWLYFAIKYITSASVSRRTNTSRDFCEVIRVLKMKLSLYKDFNIEPVILWIHSPVLPGPTSKFWYYSPVFCWLSPSHH